MAKSPDAFRTISEVSEWLDTPAHVLRFWESKFTQIRPVKRAGGRRYYRPEDMALLGGIKTLLHEQGMTIKGVQKLLREQGIRHVAALGPQPLDDGAVIDAPPAPPPPRVIRAQPLPAASAAPPPAPDNTAPQDAAPEDTSPEDTSPEDTAPPTETRPQPATVAAAPPLRRRAPLPDLPEDSDPGPGILSVLATRDAAALARRQARIAPVAARIAALRDRLRATL